MSCGILSQNFVNKEISWFPLFLALANKITLMSGFLFFSEVLATHFYFSIRAFGWSDDTSNSYAL